MSNKKEQNRIEIQLNFFGPFLEDSDLSKILDLKVAGFKEEFDRDLLISFFNLPIEALSREIVGRYIEVTTKETHTAIVPHTERLFERLLKPLRSAKKNYCLGEYSATIALCGTVAEMLALLLWEINEVRLRGQVIKKNEEKGLFGKNFDDLNHARRLNVLKTFGFISDDQFQKFEQIRKKRNSYLHSWTVNLSNEKQDALNSFKLIFQLFMEITEIGLADAGTVRVNPKILKLFNDIK
ncbi:MAG: Uncharacterized protein Athens071425_176 [Parcubacteria group bacterium Athens0714_25]|nr:MAG: Uncharacterized protein Athens071425_176 [Parcubacteria group bacterium Athens0714_25]